MTVAEVRDEISIHLEEITRLFKPGVKLTIICRHTAVADADVVMTDDDLDEAVGALQRLRSERDGRPMGNWERLLWMHEKGSSIILNGGDNGEPWECSWITGGVRYTGVSADAEMAIADALRHAGVFR